MRTIRRLRLSLALWLTLTVLLGSVFPGSVSTVQAFSSEVATINWASFTAGNPADSDALRIRDILRNANKYAVTSWWNTAKNYDAQSAATYLDFGGTGEVNIRPSASQALSLAIALKLNVYDPLTTGVSTANAKAITLKLIKSLANQHRATKGSTGWGNAWQSALWAALAGTAGWLLWEDFSVTEQNYIADMVQYEANRFTSYAVPYYRNKSGTIISSGDSKGEENSWNAMVLQLATNMMPNHANWYLWMNKNLELMISAYSRPVDTSSNSVINGKTLATWLNGSNLNADGMMVNHNIIHPDYAATVSQNIYAALLYTLGGRATPGAAFHNASVVYQALVDLNFTAGATYPGTSGSYCAPAGQICTPGGTIYTDGSSNVYYPQGSDWGNGRRMNYAGLDVQARAFGFDNLASQNAAYWEAYHAQAALDMQARHSDGHTYANNTEDNYNGKEEAVAQLAGRAYLAKWLAYQGHFRTTTQNYSIEVGIDNLSAGLVSKSGPWVTSSTSTQRIGPDYLHDNQANKGVCSITFTPNLPASGNYKVSVYYSAASNRSNAVPVEINYNGGSTTIYVNQQINGGQWVQIGSDTGYNFNAGTGGSITIRNTGTSGYVMADAVRFVKV